MAEVANRLLARRCEEPRLMLGREQSAEVLAGRAGHSFC
jgi:hypothetical protein